MVNITPTVPLEVLGLEHAEVLAWIIANEQTHHIAAMLSERVKQFRFLTAKQLDTVQQIIAETAIPIIRPPEPEPVIPDDAAMLNVAQMVIGRAHYRPKPNPVLPLPPLFDFEHPEECARTVLAILSNASGGCLLTECRVALSQSLRAANITASGAHVYYAPPDKLKTREQLGGDPGEWSEQWRDRVVIELGNVVTDEQFDGWKRARWEMPSNRI